jgi:hypothetical protein
LANRIALLKQEEMKTWKKIEETKKRCTEIHQLRKRNEEKLVSVSLLTYMVIWSVKYILYICINVEKTAIAGDGGVSETKPRANVKVKLAT